MIFMNYINKLAFITMALTSAITNATPIPQPLVRESSCPSGY
jgi:hypothetical protein